MSKKIFYVTIEDHEGNELLPKSHTDLVITEHETTLTEHLRTLVSNKNMDDINELLLEMPGIRERIEELKDVEAGANKYTHPDTHGAAMIVETPAKQFISKEEKDFLKTRFGPDTGIPFGPYLVKYNKDTDSIDVTDTRDANV